MKKKVAVAMSGGVDSGVAAALVVKAGYKAAGFHMKLWQEPVTSHQSPVTRFQNKCCSTESLEAARKTAHQLGIPFYIVDLEKIFKKKVVDYFLREYAAGLTPNPCVMCNKFIKFGELLDYVGGLGYDYLATGHYSRIAAECKVQNEKCKMTDQNSKTYHLLMGGDKHKDQSYFLYNLTQRQLAHVLFPVGEYTKKQVKMMASKWRLSVAERPESQEICFFPESDYRPFLRRYIINSIKPGEVVDTQGKVIGKHKGLPLYTIGQRHGFEIRGAKGQEDKGAKLIPPFYVIGKDTKKNRLVVGFGKETGRKEFWVEGVSWINQSAISNQQSAIKCKVRIRHQGELLGSKVQKFKGSKKVKVILDESERGIAPGQVAVFYGKAQRYPEKLRHGANEGAKVQSKKLHLCTSAPLKLSWELLGGGIIAIDRR